MNEIAALPIEWDVFKDIISKMVFDITVNQKGRKKTTAASYLVAITIGGFTGLRGSEILSLTWNDVVFKTAILKKVLKSRSGKKRMIEIHPDLMNYIEFAYEIVKPLSNDFPILANDDLKPISIQNFNKGLQRFFSRYAYDSPVSSHSLRKTFGKRVFERAGSDEKALILTCKVLGHQSVQDTRRYIGIDKLDVQRAYLSLD